MNGDGGPGAPQKLGAPQRLGASIKPLALALREQAAPHLGEVRRSLLEMRRAAARERPPRDARLRRFLYGFGLPIRVLRSLLADEEARRRYFRVLSTQLTIIVVVATAIALEGHRRDTWSGGFGAGLARAAAIASALYATLGIVEWFVVALSREHHEQLGRLASILSGAPPEDAEASPRIRLDIPWMKRKLRRKVRGFLAIAAGIPAVYLVSLVPFAGKLLYPLLAFAWTTYWVGVFTASRSAFAWRSENAVGAPAPFFMRVAERATSNTFLGRLGIPRLYVIVWRNLSEGLYPPARELEAQPYELLGIAAFRALLALPGMYLFFRPILPVASAHVLTTPFPEAGAANGTVSAEVAPIASYPKTFPRPASVPSFSDMAPLGVPVSAPPSSARGARAAQAIAEREAMELEVDLEASEDEEESLRRIERDPYQR